MSEGNGVYRVQLDVYNGPLDLLLYLVRREEVDIYDIPIARVTEQYVAYVELLTALDPNVAGEFLVLAATLMEIKSRTLLPTPPPEEADEFVDPRLELVKQLLEYKRFKDAAESLHELGVRRSRQFEPRPPGPDDEAESEADAVDLEDLQVWDLLSAFHELMAQVGRGPVTHDVIYDDTPIALHAADLIDRLERAGGSLEFVSIFEGLNKSGMIGLFLALLELVRQHRVRAEQNDTFDAIFIHMLDGAEPIEDYAGIVEQQGTGNGERGTEERDGGTEGRRDGGAGEEGIEGWRDHGIEAVAPLPSHASHPSHPSHPPDAAHSPSDVEASRD